MSKSRKISKHQQSGAVLYVALIMLILMALIGIVGLQVTGLQERMSANYRAANLAFQRTEDRAREVERSIQAAFTTVTVTFSAPAPCSPRRSVDPGGRLRRRGHTVGLSASTNVFPFEPEGARRKTETETSTSTALRADDNANTTSDAFIDTIFIRSQHGTETT